MSGQCWTRLREPRARCQNPPEVIILEMFGNIVVVEQHAVRVACDYSRLRNSESVDLDLRSMYGVMTLILSTNSTVIVTPKVGPGHSPPLSSQRDVHVKLPG